MEQIYDRALKELMEDHAAEMLPELLPGAELVAVENTELNRMNLRADLVYLIKYKSEPRILNLELQTDRDADMNYRMLLYFSELLGRYRMPIISMVMYPFETNVSEPILEMESGTGTELSFKHQTLRLWLEDAEQYFRRGVISMYTLLPAMKGVTVAMLLDAITAIELRYPQPHLAKHLLRFRTILRRSGTLKEQDKQIVEARMKSYDSLLDGDVELQKEIRELVAKRAEEKAQELAEERAQELAEKITQELAASFQQEAKRLQQEAENSIIEDRQQMVIETIEVRFPALLDIAKQNVLRLQDKNVLRILAKQITLAPDETYARLTLESFAA